ncbi:MAG: hypothetical protein QM756_43050 [Polyangiaceae bacterium]
MADLARCLRAHAVVLMACFGLACSGAQRPPDPAPQPPASASQPVSVLTSVGGSPTLPLAPEPTAAGPVAARPTEPERRSAPGSTRGTIACGEQRCAAGKEVCVFESEQRKAFICVPVKSPQVERASETYACDDGTDCAQGETCCRLPSSWGEAYRCVRRAEVGNTCAWEVCEDGGAACPKGLDCRQQFCTREVRAECGPARKRCPAERPLCLYTAHESKCVNAEEAETAAADFMSLPLEEAAGVFTCSRASDCGGGRKCCATDAGRRTFCAPTCDTGNGMRVCTSVADCTEIRALCGKDPECNGALRCRTLAVAPPWIKMCTTVEEP